MNARGSLAHTAHSPSDEPAREAIRTELDTTMLVEAGAGSGKTTLMVDRLIAYAARGTDVASLAAVTFTRKAATELRERFESRLEIEARNTNRSADECARLQHALEHRDRMFIGTVHAFCGRVLREHALEAGLPLDFAELDETETTALRAQAWSAYLDAAIENDDASVSALATLGIDALHLGEAFARFERYRDLTFPAAHAPRPRHDAMRDRLLSLLDDADALRAAGATGRRDKLQATVDRLRRGHQAHASWEHAPEFAADVRTLLTAGNRKVTQKQWGDSKQQRASAKDLGTTFDAFVDDELLPWFERWWAHAYPFVLQVFRAASNAALVSRRRSGQLGFDDLLTETARLLRENGPARRALGARWQHVLVDEFQDTDPVQAEVCFLLASDVEQGNDWRTVMLRPGSLFVVGDPKQSIYRFRRADLATYRLVEARIAACGRVERLTRNFRSVPAIGSLVNAHFANVFPPVSEQTPPHQANFAEFIAASTRGIGANAGVHHYWVGPDTKASNADIVDEDSARLASWIHARCATGERKPQDFLILTGNTKELARYAHELALRNIPVAASGVKSAIDVVIGELLVVLRALADPSNSVAVIAALEGWCAGASHVDLWEAHERGQSFSIAEPPIETASVVGAGLATLHAWWHASTTRAPASLVERILDDSGFFLLASSDDLGDRNGGLLLQLVAMLRGAVGMGGDLTSAIAAIEQALTQSESDPVLRVGRDDAVRLMNLHKAKGLEAPVVVLAAPVDPPKHDIELAVWRDDADAPLAAMVVHDDRGNVVAAPGDWPARSAEELVRQKAERDRLLYVAVTRAEDELVIARRAPHVVSRERRTDSSAWSPLAATLDAQSSELDLPIVAPSGRRTLDVSADEMQRRVAHASAARATASVSSVTLQTITEAAKRTAAMADADGAPFEEPAVSPMSSVKASRHRTRYGRVGDDATALDPQKFGSLVHLAIEGALRGRDDADLARYVEAHVWQEFPRATASERSSVVARVLRVVAEARASDAWSALLDGSMGALAGPRAELSVATVTTDGSRGTVLVEGVIDAVAHTDAGWLVVDWKNSAQSDAGWDAILPTYEAQGETYLAALRNRTGSAGTVRVVRLTG